MVKVGSMRNANRILLMAAVVAVGVQGADASLWKHRKTDAASAPAANSAAATSLTGIDTDAARVTLRMTGAPAYTSYSPSPAVFVVDLTSTSRDAALAIPSSGLPAGVSSLSAEETTEMGMLLTRVTFRLTQPETLQAAVAGNALVVTVPSAAAALAAKSRPAAVPGTAAAEPVIETAALTPEPAAAPVVVSSPAVSGRRATTLRRIETSGSGDSVEVRLIGDGAIAYKSFRLENPPRLVIDLPGVKSAVTRSSAVVEGSAVQHVRVSQFKPLPDAVTRVVLDLAPAAKYAIAAGADQLRVRFGDARAAAAQSVSDDPRTVAAAQPQATAVITANTDQSPPDTRRQLQTTSAVGATSAARSAAAASAGESVFTEAPAPATGHSEPQLLSGTPTVSGGRSLVSGPKVYSGEPISLSLKDADIREVLRTFSDITGLNIAVDPQVTGQVTVNFTDVPWDQALDIILAQNSLTWVLTGNVMRVGTIDRITTERTAARRLEEEDRLNVPLDTYIFKLSYARAGDVQSLMKDVASPRAKIIVDPRTNQLIVSEIPAYLKTIASLIETIDVPTRQVTIEARIVEVTKTFQQQFGFQWGFNGAFDPALGNGTGLIFPNRMTYTGGPFNFGPGNSVLQMSLFDVLGTFNLDLALNASEAEGLAKVISAPRVTTQDNTPANIESGVQIPIQTRINFTTTVQYVSATLRLGVTPQITESGTVIMEIDVQKNTPAPGLAIEGAAGTPIQTRTARTKLMVRDGGTAVIGGIYQMTDNNSQTRMPFVHQIPVLGKLFKSHNISTTRDELLIFITPRIIRGI